MQIELLTKEDLMAFKEELLSDLKDAFEKKTPKSKKWLRTTEVMEMLNISSGTLQNYRINGTIPYTKIGNTLYYPMEEIERMLEKGMM